MLLKPALVLFDVYDTLLDMTLVERRVNDLLDSKRGYIYWFELLMQYCFLENSLATFNRFPAIAGATLKMAGKTFGKQVTESQTEQVVDLLHHLPLKEGTTEILSGLYDHDYRITALTNAPRDMILSRMERTGLISYFEAVISADEVGKYKPEREVYQKAAVKLGVHPNEILFVSSHSWDIAGAANAGFQTAFIQQETQLFYPLAQEPTFNLKKLAEIISHLNEADPNKKAPAG